MSDGRCVTVMIFPEEPELTDSMPPCVPSVPATIASISSSFVVVGKRARSCSSWKSSGVTPASSYLFL